MSLKITFRASFLIGLVILIVLLTSIFLVGLSKVLELSLEMEEKITWYYEKKSALNKMLHANRERLLIVWNTTLTDDELDRIDYQDSLLEQGSIFLEAREQLRKLGTSDEENALLYGVQDELNSGGPRLTDIMQSLNENHSDVLIKKDIASALPRQNSIQSSISKIIELQDEGIKKVQASARGEVSNIIFTTIWLMFAAFLSGSLYAYRIIRRSNIMLAMIKSSERKLSKLNLELEHRVKQRTVELRRANRLLSLQVKYDPLTGLANRRHLQDQMKLYISLARRNKECLAVLFIDLDGFKEVNDIHGHDIGDGVLVEISKLLKSVVRDSDLVARYGGDEFIVVVKAVANTSTIDNIVENIIKKINVPKIIKGIKIKIGASVGISIYPADTEDEILLLKYADSGMYNSKKCGKNQYTYYKQLRNHKSLLD